MIKQTLRCVVIVSCGWLMTAGSLLAHHSLAATYVMGGDAEVAGAFKAFRLVNPHSSMKMDVTNEDGSITEWTFTGGSVSTLARLGLGRTGPNALRPGDMITVTYMPPLDGKSPLGLLKTISYEDGRMVQFRVD
ncbi:DUF6152 family protein [Candidatus Rariloculus sp.]|uniref:DUF6152 family protein n=1 Tax=Candidatus Rariloculus sp. TaxID=3101265 RepID=UPI003D0BE283